MPIKVRMVEAAYPILFIVNFSMDLVRASNIEVPKFQRHNSLKVSC